MSRYVGHADGEQRTRRHLVGRLLEPWVEDEELQPDPERGDVRHGERAIAPPGFCRRPASGTQESHALALSPGPTRLGRFRGPSLVDGDGYLRRRCPVPEEKGLDEMNPGTLKETTLDPARRALLRVAIRDATATERV